MAISHDKSKGILFVIIGSILFVLFMGKFLIPIVGTFVGIILINYGLYLQHLPPVWVLIQEWLMNLKFK